MKRFLVLTILIISCSGCAMLNGGAYNSRNLIDLIGEDMDFNYGFIAVDNVDRVIVLRETNAGNTEAPKPLPPYNANFCPSDDPGMSYANDPTSGWELEYADGLPE